jgi:hypothetical protein
MISAHPLQWPDGWPRTPAVKRKSANFSKNERRYPSAPGGSSWIARRSLTVSDGVERVLDELGRMGVTRDDVVISTNVRVRLDGLPRSGEANPQDPGAAVYWEKRRHDRPNPFVMAIDHYDNVADNLAAIAATLEAMRAIERHGGAQVLERAFTGFTALPNPTRPKTWREVLGFVDGVQATRALIAERYRERAQRAHPDRGGSHDAMAELNAAREAAEREVRS